MTNKKVVIGIGIAILFQFAVLIGEYINAAIPLWTGREIKIRTIPVDPRSMFRGNYARLRYDVSQIETKKFPEGDELKNGEYVYIRLRPDANDLYIFDSISLNLPDKGVFLRGRIANRKYENDTNYYRIKYGIEAFFATKEKAITLEKHLTLGGIAVLMVADNGKASLKNVLPK